jgi:conjugal transfer ATP-binding protein TraC
MSEPVKQANAQLRPDGAAATLFSAQAEKALPNVTSLDDEVRALQPLIARMASPMQQLDPDVYASLATVIKEERIKHGRNTTVAHIWERYQKGRLSEEGDIDQRLLDLADQLAPYAARGAYANYFGGQS